MKKALLITTLLLVFFLTTGIASARVFFHLGVFPPAVIGPPVIVAPPPAYYPYPDSYYGPGYSGILWLSVVGSRLLGQSMDRSRLGESVASRTLGVSSVEVETV